MSKIIALLITLILCFLTSEGFGQKDPPLETLEDRPKQHLEADPTTMTLLGQIYSQPMTA